MARKITIQGALFEIDDPYAAGHSVNDNEAKALNQVRGENIRNNFAKTVKDTQGEAKELTEDQHAELQSKLNDYAANYVFNVSGGRTTDPLEKETKRIAQELLDGKIAKKGTSKKKYIEEHGQERYDELLSQFMELEAVQKEAEANVKKKQKLADSIEF